uniref:60S ribosomal protein L10P insertion domain-containing protein n=1 Tax=Meloidogyne javanica TaxID=6303 RepID=A0A915LH26_MELJA
MPKSKRDKIVSLTKVKKKTKETKGKLIDEVRECISKYNNLFVFSTANLRSNILIKIRQHFKQNSRIFYGRNGVMAVALGKTPEQEVENGLYNVAQMLKGKIELLERFVVCKEGDKLSSDQTKILRHFGRRLVEFRITLLAFWSKKKGFKRFKEAVDDNTEKMDED